MKINENTALATHQILLVPYAIHHVPTYHTWLQDPTLQAATASEPLSLSQEYSMQKSWREDPDKLTFIICLPLSAAAQTTVYANMGDSPDRMIGDINLFLFPLDSESQEDAEKLGGTWSIVGEIEVMIARKELQRRGFGRAALLTFLDYVLLSWSNIGSEYAQKSAANTPAPPMTSHPTASSMNIPQLAFLRVKIHQSNLGSIRLFESVGFIRAVEDANYFGEIELIWVPDVSTLRKQKGWERANQLQYREGKVEDARVVGFDEETGRSGR